MKQTREAYCHVSTPEEREKEIERLRSKARHNEASALNNAERKGLQKGRREGRQEGRWEAFIELARKMKIKGADVEYIIEMTGLTIDDILRL